MEEGSVAGFAAQVCFLDSSKRSSCGGGGVLVRNTLRSARAVAANCNVVVEGSLGGKVAVTVEALEASDVRLSSVVGPEGCPG